MDITKKKAIFIDLDGTLINTSSGKTFPTGIWDMKLNMPVFEQLKKLHPLAVLIVSNQGGIELGIVPQQLFEPKFIYVIASLQHFIGFHTLIAGQFCSSNDPANENRKPNTGMLEGMIKQFQELAHTQIDKSECLMIGDASGWAGDHSDTDKRTAENFGCDYLDVRDFIKLELPEPRFKFVCSSTGDVLTREGKTLENIPESEVEKTKNTLEMPAKSFAVVSQLWVKPHMEEKPVEKPAGKVRKLSKNK